MRIIPAIDLIDGNAVRLYQGDYARQETYGTPLHHARMFLRQGAKALHVVDLSGAKCGYPNHLDILRLLKNELPSLHIEWGGGIRDMNHAQMCLAAGADEIILGTAALKDAAFFNAALEKYAEKVVVGVDARDGLVAVSGWLETSGQDSISFCHALCEKGVKRIIYTDIVRDGTGQGANIKIYRTLCDIQGLSITASGGISAKEDLKTLRDMGVEAVIVGKALYNGTLSLNELLEEENTYACEKNCSVS